MTATLKPESKSTSRRALLAGALGGIGALAATVIGRPAAMRATNGETVLVGGQYFSSSATSITNSTGGSGTGGTGIWGGSNASIGVFGSSGVSTGVLGSSGSQPGPKDKTGVYGYAAQDKYSRGVRGESPAGIGVYGISTSGYGVYSAGRVYTTQFYELIEIAPTPAAPVANRARLFLRSNSVGKTQLCVRFQAGAVVVLATQP